MPFVFLLLPREVRDQIYTYTLLAPSLLAETTPRPRDILHIENHPFKSPTPGLLRANKQIYQEGIEILYSKNIFKFAHPFGFEGKIRAVNRQLICSICIYTRFPSQTEIVPSPELVPDGWEIVTDQWDSYKEEIRGMEEEFRDGLEPSDTEWAFDIGEVESSDEE